jgi:hypothetical protein
VAAVLATTVIGWRLGVHTGGRGRDNISILESGLLGLLALIIGFTFAMALSRFETRREAIVNEANSIGTTALRARLLPEPNRAESLKLLREYVEIRIDVAQSGRSLAELNAVIDRSNTIQEALWQQVKAVSNKDSSLVPTGIFIQSLNEMIDNQGKRLAALRNRIPSLVLLALFGMASITCGFAGYAGASEAKPTRLPIYIIGVLISSVIYLILDIDRPSGGLIKNNQQPMIDAAASIASFPE